MVDLPKIPVRNELTPQVQSSVSARDISSVHTSWGSALESLATGVEDIGAPMAEEAGRKAVTRDEQGNLKVEALPIAGKLGKIAQRSAELTFSVQAEGEIERNLLDLRNKTWKPANEGGGGGDPNWFDQAARQFITQFAGQHRGGYQGIAMQIGERTANGHAKGLMVERERLDVKNQGDVLKAREEELRNRLSTLAFDNGTNSEEFEAAVGDLAAIRKQRAADPRFNYSPAEAGIDTSRDMNTLRGMAIVGQARRDFQATGDLVGAQRRAEEALVASGVPIDERSKMLGQINSHLSGMSAVRQVQKQELRDQSLDIDTRIKLGEKIPEDEIGRLIGGMVASGMHTDARRLAVTQAMEFGRSLIQPGMTAEDRVKALERAGTYPGVQVPAAGAKPVSASPGTAGNTLNVARAYLGMTEDNGAHAATLQQFMKKSAGHNINPSQTAWCAAFADAVLGAGGFKTRGSMTASDFLDYGTVTDKPSQGDLVVFKSLARGSTGHLGFVTKIENGRVHYIAGNDGGEVAESSLPLDKVAGFRIPPRAGSPVQGVTDATAPAAVQQKAATVAFGSTYAGAVALSAASAANDKIIEQQLADFEKSFSLPGGAPSSDQMRELLDSAPTASAPALREKLRDALLKNEGRMAALHDPERTRAALAQLELKAADGTMPLIERQAMKAMQDGIAAQDKEMESKPYLAGTRMTWDGDAPINTMRAAALPLEFGNSETLRAQIAARSTSSQLLEVKTGRTASPLMLAEDAEKLRGAAPGMDAGTIQAVFSSLASARREPLYATLKDKAAREALVSLTRTTDPVKFNAAMSGLDMLMQRDPKGFQDAMDSDTLEKVLKWRDNIGLYSDPKAIERLLNPEMKGKESEIQKAQRGKGEKIAREMDDKELQGSFRTFFGRFTGSNPDPFIEMGPGQDRSVSLPQNALRADLANAIGEFMAFGMSEDGAKAAALTKIQKVWGVSGVTGQIMKHAPDRIYEKHFGFTTREMDAEVQAALGTISGRVAATDEEAAVLGRERIPFALVPGATTQADFKAWQDWEAAGGKGPPPAPPRYQILFEDRSKNPPQLRMVEDDSGNARLFRWDVSKKRAEQQREFSRTTDAHAVIESTQREIDASRKKQVNR